MEGPIISLYNKFDIKKQNCVYTSAVPVKSTTEVEPPLHSGKIEACRALKLTHKGSYEHLGTAWATAMANQRHKKLKLSKVQPCYEVYVSDPDNTPAEELVTEIYLPVR